MTTTTNPTTVANEILAQLEQAWNDGDGAAFGAPFTLDADFVDIRGAHHEGRGAIAGGHQGIFDSIYKGSTVSYSLDTVRPVADGCLVAVASGTLDAPVGPLAGVNHARFTMTLVEDAGAWSVAAFHNTIVQSTG
jgi:uncharacterized protein (TIGR02246 family)